MSYRDIVWGGGIVRGKELGLDFLVLSSDHVTEHNRGGISGVVNGNEEQCSITSGNRRERLNTRLGPALRGAWERQFEKS